jgi:hypothetical protein
MNRRLALGCLLAAPAGRGFSQVEAAPAHLEVGSSIVDVLMEPGSFDVGRAALLAWVKLSARAVSAYFGRFPVAQARVRIVYSPRGSIAAASSFGSGGAHCRIAVGKQVTNEDLGNDWKLTHEMVHFGFPSVEDRHRWIEEGSATYIEPIARAMIGELTVEKVWGDMVRDMPQGLPLAGDRGLNLTRTWGRTYWGGALFCLLADVEMRKRTGNRKGFQHALQAVNRAGGTIEADWPLERVIEIGDKAVGGAALDRLYRQQALKPAMVDLADLWNQLGVHRSGNTVVFDNQAPLAAIRASIAG